MSRTRHKIICANCGIEIVVFECVEMMSQRFCSKYCVSEWFLKNMELKQNA